MSDAQQAIADVIRKHRIIRCSVSSLTESQQWGMCDGCDFLSDPGPIKGVVWDVLAQDISAVHQAEMVAAALGGLTRQVVESSAAFSGEPSRYVHRWVSGWTPEERSEK